MNVLFIDDNELFVSYVFNQLRNKESLKKIKISLSSNLNDLFDDVNKLIRDEDIIFINSELFQEPLKRQNLGGIQILKWLRLKRINNHCVLYSFLNREQIIQHSTENIIIFSEGITFLHLPCDFGCLDVEKICKIQSKNDLSEYFKAESRLPDDRHFFANWWGVLQLWNVQKAVEKIAGKTHLSDIEKTFSSSINEMNSYQGLLARYLKGISDPEIEKSLQKLYILKNEKFENENRKKSEIKKEIDRISEEKEIIDGQITLLEEINASEKNSIIAKIRSLFPKLPNSVQQKLDELQKKIHDIDSLILTNEDYIEIIELIENEKEKVYEEYRKMNRQLASKISILEKSKHFSTSDFSLENIRKKLSEEKPKIIYVDDQASDGWASIFQRMIYGGESDSFTIIEPNEADDVEVISNDIITTLHSQKAELIILDLRLKSEKGSIVDPSKISGIQVLKLLQEQKILCPILITTASNKLWSYKETFSNGATAFWTKEGLDEQYDIDASVENYLRFLDLIYLLCYNDEIKLLYRDFLNKILTFKNSSNREGWWATPFWGDRVLVYPKNKFPEHDDIVCILYQAFELYEDIIRLKIQNIENVQFEKNIYSLIVLRLAEIIELIHQVDKNDISLYDEIKDQLPTNFYSFHFKLYNIRNIAAHSFNINFNQLNDYVKYIFEYLENSVTTVPARVEAVDGEQYTSTIASQSHNANQYKIYNPNLNIESKYISMYSNNIIDRCDGIEIVGLKIRFTLKFKITENQRVVYYAQEIKIIN